MSHTRYPPGFGAARKCFQSLTEGMWLLSMPADLHTHTSDAFVSRITSSRPAGGISRWGYRSFLAAAEQVCSLIACSTLLPVHSANGVVREEGHRPAPVEPDRDMARPTIASLRSDDIFSLVRAREPILLFPLALVPFACHWAKCVAKARAFTPTVFGLRSTFLEAAPSTGDRPASRNLGPVRTWQTEAPGVRHPHESTAIDCTQSLHLLHLTVDILKPAGAVPGLEMRFFPPWSCVPCISRALMEGWIGSPFADAELPNAEGTEARGEDTGGRTAQFFSVSTVASRKPTGRRIPHPTASSLCPLHMERSRLTGWGPDDSEFLTGDYDRTEGRCGGSPESSLAFELSLRAWKTGAFGPAWTRPRRKKEKKKWKRYFHSYSKPSSQGRHSNLNRKRQKRDQNFHSPVPTESKFG
ncbi:uncharacterized protein CLUP02_16306 [Colletotrichum lupini]|uniref:Uncharacterized protein n=1 Tax=Colletotrichum lupini TaxID=145971 RepID=A0A9Q8T9V6_9PEZI|nr:uncharacterized protein CLUP02_16306 [Colletotrichum lupini]UQC90776.1 hypothetical protein CLUP02_16306 [Colletotrichum lupini]